MSMSWNPARIAELCSNTGTQIDVSIHLLLDTRKAGLRVWMAQTNVFKLLEGELKAHGLLVGGSG